MFWRSIFPYIYIASQHSPNFSIHNGVYSLILDFSAETIWALLSRLWTFGARCAFLFFHAYRGMLLWWSSSTFIWTEERIRMHTFLSFMHRIARAGHIVETLTFTSKLLQHIDISLSLYDLKCSFIFVFGGVAATLFLKEPNFPAGSPSNSMIISPPWRPASSAAESAIISEINIPLLFSIWYQFDLAKLMIEHSVGVQVKEVIKVSKIDQDFFSDDES